MEEHLQIPNRGTVEIHGENTVVIGDNNSISPRTTINIIVPNMDDEALQKLLAFLAAQPGLKSKARAGMSNTTNERKRQ